MIVFIRIYILLRILTLNFFFYTSDPMDVLTMSYHLKMSGFYSGKGKGKRTVSDEENSVESKPSPDRDSEEEFLLKRAKYLSLQSDKVGEPSKNPVNSPQKEEFEMISYYTKQ